MQIDDPALVNEIADSYTSEREDTVQPFQGAIETLRKLRHEGVHLALISNGNAEGQRRKIDKFNLSDFFDYILIEGEFGVGKPDERVYFQVLNQLNVKPEESWILQAGTSASVPARCWGRCRPGRYVTAA